MRVSWEEPTGIQVQGTDGEMVTLTFPAFVAAIHEGRILPTDRVRSRIVTDGRWVAAAEMRLYQMLTAEWSRIGEQAASESLPTWPPPPTF